MVLLAATAIGLAPAPRNMTHFPETLRAIALSFQGLKLEGKSLETIIRDPNLSLFLNLNTPIAEMPGSIKPGWALFAPNGPQLAKHLAAYLCFGLWPLLFTWGLALFLLRWRKPRPKAAQIPRQPGFWVGLAPIVGFWWFLVIGNFRATPWDVVVIPAAFLVPWLILTVTRLWRAEPSWIDRCGRWIGVAWITTVPIWLWANLR